MAGTTDFNWIRQIRLTISGRAHVLDGKTYGVKDKVLLADGSADRLRISARIQKRSILGDPTQIMIWNLSPETRASLQRTKTKIHIETCWRDGPRGGDWNEAFYGELLNFETYRNDADIVTVIYALSGLTGTSRATHYKTYSGIDVKSVCESIAATLAGESDGAIKFDPKNILGVKGRIGSEGWGAVGFAKDSMNRLARQYGFSWSIVDRNIRVTGDGAKGARTTTIKDPELIAVNPKFATPLQYDVGLSFACQYNPAIAPHDGVKFQSAIPENRQRYGGTYKVIQVTHDIDSHNPQSFVTSGSAYVVPVGE